MPKFIFAYRAPADYTPTRETAAEWMAWFDGMGDKLVDKGQPTVAQASLGNCSPESTQFHGYSVIEADYLEAAAAVAKSCPIVGRGGGVEVGQMRELPVGRPTGQPVE